MAKRELGVWLEDQRVAVLTAPRVGRLTCRYDRAVLDALDLNTPLLSCSLPLRTGRLDAWPFATGLLPEGRHRQSMAALAGVAAHDVFGMLERFGRDVAGAVIISPDDPPLRDAHAQPYTATGLEDAVASIDEHPLGLDDESELSIAGLQDKMLLVALPDGSWARPQHGYPSTHILKVDDRVRPGLVRAEHACLQLARAAGLDAADSRLMTIGAEECLAVRRFDRVAAPDGTIRRIHQEDSCQALGIDPEDNQRRAKYEQWGGPRLRDVAGLLDAWATDPATALTALLDQMVFTVLIGNADAHGKNVSLLHPRPGEIALAPLYDTVPTAVWPTLRVTAAMTIGGVSRLADVTPDDVVREAVSWSMPERTARARAGEVAEAMREVLASDRIEVDSPTLDLVTARTESFLASRST